MGPQKWQEGDIELMQEETSEVGITLLYSTLVDPPREHLC